MYFVFIWILSIYICINIYLSPRIPFNHSNRQLYIKGAHDGNAGCSSTTVIHKHTESTLACICSRASNPFSIQWSGGLLKPQCGLQHGQAWSSSEPSSAPWSGLHLLGRRIWRYTSPITILGLDAKKSELSCQLREMLGNDNFHYLIIWENS